MAKRKSSEASRDALKKQLLKMPDSELNALFDDAQVITKLSIAVEESVGHSLRNSFGEYKDGKWVKKIPKTRSRKIGSRKSKGENKGKGKGKATAKAISTETVESSSEISSETDGSDESDEDNEHDEDDGKSTSIEDTIKEVIDGCALDDAEFKERLLTDSVARLNDEYWVDLKSLSGNSLVVRVKQLINSVDKEIWIEDGMPEEDWDPHEFQNKLVIQSPRKAPDFADLEKVLLNIPEDTELALKEIKELNIVTPYNPATIGRLLVLNSWSGSTMSVGSLKTSVEFVMAKAKSFKLKYLLPAIVQKLLSYSHLEMKAGGDQINIILGLLQKGNPDVTWEVEKAAELEKSQVEGSGSKTTIAKSRVYNRLGERGNGTDAWGRMTNAQKSKACSRYQQFKAYGKKLAVLVDHFGIGILFILNAQEAKNIANLAVTKWTSAIPKALIEIISRSPDAKHFASLNEVISEFLPQLIRDEKTVSDCMRTLVDWATSTNHPACSSLLEKNQISSNLLLNLTPELSVSEKIGKIIAELPEGDIFVGSRGIRRKQI